MLEATPILSVTAFGADPTGTASSAAAFNAAIASAVANGIGTVFVPPGTYTVDTISLPANISLVGAGKSSCLSFIAHTTTHNPMITIGTLATSVSNVTVKDIRLLGNSALQTYVGEEWSPGIFIWGSSWNTISNVHIRDTQGDGITLGYDTGRYEGSDFNIIEDCDIASTSRINGVAITWGDYNKIWKNRCEQNIDLEPNASYGRCWGNQIIGNLGNPDNLMILLESVNLSQDIYKDNIITGNICGRITCGPGSSFLVTGNQIRSQDNLQPRLVSFVNASNSLFIGNIISVATPTYGASLTEIIRTSGGYNLLVSQNIVHNANILFHNYIDNNADNVIFTNNLVSEEAQYNSGSTETPAQTALYRVVAEGGVATATQIAGSKTKELGVGASANNFTLTPNDGSGLSTIFDFLPECALATDSLDYNYALTYRKVASTTTSVQTFTIYTCPIGVTMATYTQVLANSDSAIFFVQMIY